MNERGIKIIIANTAEELEGKYNNFISEHPNYKVKLHYQVVDNKTTSNGVTFYLLIEYEKAYSLHG